MKDILNKLDKLKKTHNQQYLALCPFHQERNPSFSLNLAKEVYYCHGCGAKGSLKTLCDYLKLNYNGKFKHKPQKVNLYDLKETNINAFLRVISSCLIPYDKTKAIPYFVNKGLNLTKIPNTFVVQKTFSKVSAGGFYIKEAKVGDILIFGKTFCQHIFPLKDKFSKKFIYGSQVRNNFLKIKVNDEPETVFCEGFATGLTYAKIGFNVMICFNYHNLIEVAKNHKTLATNIISVDNDEDFKQDFLIKTLKRFGIQHFITFKGEAKGFDANDFFQQYGTQELKTKISENFNNLS